MMTCREVARLVSRRQEEPLPRFRLPLLWFHLLLCGMCRNYSRQLRWLRSALRAGTCGQEPPLDESVAESLDAEACRRLKERLRQE